ncbi:DDE-type integrase/transposase/recombinase [Bacillus aryabhattai]|uniref:DDE-type integrase/transposase/recombinase n=1 Tax=Priestia aryabhattai TaxID=412384 RepID=UPI0018748042|nr:DDE-type integrase/transposase/recombinase [Priestia aryabhattai]MBE5102273.1 DDE-type integrase/transposase/recombinase [Priestia aryabhattai]
MLGLLILLLLKGRTINFYLSKLRNTQTAKCFFKKALAVCDSITSRSRIVMVDKNSKCPLALEQLKEKKMMFKVILPNKIIILLRNEYTLCWDLNHFKQTLAY